MKDTLFKKVDYSLSKLIEDIELGEIGLPDIQRPFVWNAAKVRDLFDSMYKGFPVGYLLFWLNGLSDGHRQIGIGRKQKVPRLLIVDGQQRLTSLYAVLRGKPVLRKDYTVRDIHIAFRPKDGKFEVTDAAIRKDPEFIPDISQLWSGEYKRHRFVKNFIKSLQKHREVSEDEEDHLFESIDRLYDIRNYPFTVLELSSTIDEEDVADVFVRINSKGVTLNQADFILTLMSVFWDEGRTNLERFCHAARKPSVDEASPFNHFIQPDPDQLLRVSVGLGFRRARLQHVYSILRGKDLETGQFSNERRVQQFDLLKSAQSKVLDLQNWHEFQKALVRAGFRSGSMISSQVALLYSYVMFLIGKCDFNIGVHDLRDIVARWFFMTALTARYSASPETSMEADLAQFRPLKTKEEFVATLEKIIQDALTEDFWNITLPNELATSAGRSPSMFAYYASLNLLEARVLFSKMKVAELVDPALKAKKAPIERHHLFPKKHLQMLEITEVRDTNQIANFALVEWSDNIHISDSAPSEYYPEYAKEFSAEELERMCYWHALPLNWERMKYKDFIDARRKLIAGVIRDGFDRLVKGEATQIQTETIPIKEIITKGESTQLEFKSTLRINLHTGDKDPRLEHACLKTIAGFLNSSGGTLVIGVKDDGEPIGVETDKFPNEDKMNLHLVNLLRDRIGPQNSLYIYPRFETYGGRRVLAVECSPSKSPVYLKGNNSEHFFIRTGAATTELTASQIQSYIHQRFGA
ncbi:MAG: DUF262 domain-containing protein [Desulfobulbaceae bacterium]|nr:DUF262 domain-containing protein [Desulfobulbaceae bacterium]